MKHLVMLLATVSTVVIAQTPLKPRATPVPAAVRQWVTELAGICSASGGKPSKSPDLIKYADLNGDGVTDYVVDEGAFNCDGAASSMVNGQSGSNLSVFVGEPANTATKAYSASVYANEIDGAGAHVRLYVGVSGPSCGQRNAASLPFSQVAFCLRPLNWISGRRNFVLGPLSEMRPFPQN